MPKRKTEVVEISGKKILHHGNRRWLVWTRTEFGKRLKRYCESWEEAEETKAALLEEFHGHGAAASALTALDRADAVRARAILDGRTSLERAAAFWTLHHPATPAPLLSEAVAAFIKERQRWVADRRLGDLQRRLVRFAGDYAVTRVSEVSETLAKEWLERPHKNRRPGQKGSRPFTAWGRNNYLRDLQMFFEWCASEKSWCTTNPFRRLKKDPVKRREAPEIYTAEEAEKLIDAAIAHPELDLLAYYTLGLFAGVRVAELGRVTWDMIDLEAQEITLSGKITKTYQPRTIELSPNVIAKLKMIKHKSGPIMPVQDPKKRRYKLHQLAAVGFRTNGLRHSFASHHAKLHKNATELQLIMGQKTPSVLFNHYIASTRAEDAKAYFEI